LLAPFILLPIEAGRANARPFFLRRIQKWRKKSTLRRFAPSTPATDDRIAQANTSSMHRFSALVWRPFLHLCAETRVVGAFGDKICPNTFLKGIAQRPSRRLPVRMGNVLYERL